MPGIRGVGAWVTTAGGADVEEYAMETVDDRSMACYITSEAGQEFMIRVKSDVTFEDARTTMLFRINVDGHSLTGKVCGSGDEKFVDGVLGEAAMSQRPERCKVEYLDPRDEPYARLQFRYRPIEVLDSLGLLAPAPPIAYREHVNVKAEALAGHLGDDHSAHRAEKKRKGLGESAESPRPSRKVKQEVEAYPSPMSMPYTPVKHEPQDRIMVDNDGSDLELETMEERLRALQSAIQRKKAKRESRVKVKRERSPIRVPPSQTGAPIVIDLT
ncbi:hypothetical protein EIP91_010965 [Steccherinum ochraceum]|uniref:DUF7918 domain-containing protein n=1 Tax=Steccherinum ochraceum TaxID=92696 RepID=A0A4V2MX11_9APHY|nr:hypothetical protein EIP91_010965 [Steccherinum ochraceum]